MKTYKILKQFNSGYSVGNTILTTLDKVGSLGIPIAFLLQEGYIEEIKKDIKSIYNLKDGDKYRFIDDDYAECNYTNWADDKSDEIGLSMGNIFLTKKEAEAKIDKDKAIAKIERWKYENDNVELDWNISTLFKYFVDYHIINELSYDNALNYKSSTLPYYSSQEIVEKAMKELKDEYILLLTK